jgi:hypothetical protein
LNSVEPFQIFQWHTPFHIHRRATWNCKFSRETAKIGHQDIDELALAAFQGGKMAESEIFMLRLLRNYLAFSPGF